MNILILSPIILAFILGISILICKTSETNSIMKKGIVYTILISALTFSIVFSFYNQSFTVVEFNDILSISFKIDALGAIFISLISFLWPFASVYASKYMTHEGGEKKFFAYYTMTFGTVIALSFSANMLTMYLFYEVLSFITLPLVIHNNKQRDLYAGKVYIMYSVLGASISFVGMMLFMYNTGTWQFNSGVLNGVSNDNMLLIAYILMFTGFAVKAGIFPFNKWLIAAGVAPTTVTALLHAVAVVKSGVFAVMRVTYYLYTPEYLLGTYAQYTAMILSIITIIFGSSMAMKNKHLKRRFAYSTVSQLSYILLAVSSMSIYGLVAAMMHTIFHALIKIVIFYTAGNVMFVNHKEYVSDIEGYGKKMKLTFVSFTISSIALIGIPPFGGFSSKFSIATSVISVGGWIGFIGVLALMISALLTAMYLLQIAVLAFIPHNDFDNAKLKKVSEAPKEMSYTLAILTTVMVIASFSSSSIYTFIQTLLIGGY